MKKQIKNFKIFNILKDSLNNLNPEIVNIIFNYWGIIDINFEFLKELEISLDKFLTTRGGIIFGALTLNILLIPLMKTLNALEYIHDEEELSENLKILKLILVGNLRSPGYDLLQESKTNTNVITVLRYKNFHNTSGSESSDLATFSQFTIGLLSVASLTTVKFNPTLMKLMFGENCDTPQNGTAYSSQRHEKFLQIDVTTQKFFSAQENKGGKRKLEDNILIRNFCFEDTNGDTLIALTDSEVGLLKNYCSLFLTTPGKSFFDIKDQLIKWINSYIANCKREASSAICRHKNDPQLDQILKKINKTIYQAGILKPRIQASENRSQLEAAIKEIMEDSTLKTDFPNILSEMQTAWEQISTHKGTAIPDFKIISPKS